MAETKRDFFISYNKADKEWAKWIAAVLEADGYSTYLQAWDFRPGGDFVLDMNRALLQSERFIAVLSEDYLASLYCQAEWASAFTKDPNGEKRLFLPVRVADVKPEALLASRVYIDLFGADEETAEQTLLHGVDGTDVPRKRPPFPGKTKARFPGGFPAHNLPRRNGYFTGRDEILDAIRTGFERGSAISLTQTITGLGGLGKTQTALEYAYRYAGRYACIWWVPAETEGTVLAAYKAFAAKMGLLKQDQSNEELMESIHSWMDRNPDWLFIYDNADTLSPDTWWLPGSGRGHVLLTTRYRHSFVGKDVDLPVFSEDEAASFLERRTEIEDDATARLLSERLGRLPLALEQAAAYIKINRCTYGNYLELLDEYGLAVLEEVDGVINYAKPVTATWEISLSRISHPAARQLLNLCAYLAPEKIYKALFEKNLDVLPSPLREALSNKLESNKVWKALTKYSLLEGQDGNFYAMHRLLQEVVRNSLQEDLQWFQCVLHLLYEAYDFSYENQAGFLIDTTHVEALLAAAVTPDEKTQKRIAFLCAEAGYGNTHLGDYPKALKWYQKDLEISETVLGTEHPHTAVTYNNIASVYSRQGEYPKALEWYQKALAIRENALGTEHPDTATTYNNIALVYSRQGECPKALEWYQKALAIREKALGIEHPDTAATYNNIAGVYSRQGDYSKALEWYQKALAIYEKALGAEHPNTAVSYNNIALVYDHQGDYTKALEWYWKALAIREKVLGTEHPDTAATYNNIAFVYSRQGDSSKALEWYQKALAIFETRLGEGHPHTLTVKANMAELTT